MIKNNIKLKTILVLLFIIIYSILTYFVTTDKNNRVSIEQEQILKNLTLHYELTIDNFLSDAKILENIIQNDKQVITLFSKAANGSKKEQDTLREELHKILLPLYLRAKQKGVHQMHLQFSDNITFLRMHKPEKYGEDLTDIRYSYKYTNKTKKPVFGFEQGKSSHAIRYVFPIFKDGVHIGASEVALSTNYIQNKLRNVNKLHTHFLVDKQIFDVKTWETKHLVSRYIKSIENDNYMFALDNHVTPKDILNTKKLIKPLKNDIAYNISLKEPFALNIIINKKAKIIAFLPIKNIKDKKVVAYLVSYNDSPHLDSIFSDYKRLLIGLFFIILILFYFIYKTLKNKEELKSKIEEKTKKLKELNENLEAKVNMEVAKNRKKDELLAKQSQSAALGEMMDAIAHQWKQPLGVISLHVQSLSLGLNYGVIANSDDIKEVSKKVKYQTEHLISTIDEFRSFFRQNQEMTNVNIKNLIEETFHLMKDSLIIDNIKTEVFGDNTQEIECLPNELKHIFINLINNSIDAFIENNIKNRIIRFELIDDANKFIIKISDNAGGIPSNILDKVFLSNFTTKEDDKGTGIGLYLSKQIIEKIHGTIEVSNHELQDKNKIYQGVQFKITLPISQSQK